MDIQVKEARQPNWETQEVLKDVLQAKLFLHLLLFDCTVCRYFHCTVAKAHSTGVPLLKCELPKQRKK